MGKTDNKTVLSEIKPCQCGKEPKTIKIYEAMAIICKCGHQVNDSNINTLIDKWNEYNQVPERWECLT